MRCGWRGEREFRVARREVESELITSFYLEPLDGAALLAFVVAVGSVAVFVWFLSDALRLFRRRRAGRP